MRSRSKLVFLAVSAALVVAATPALASTGGTPDTVPGAANASLATHGAINVSSDRALAYWTPERMAAAKPIESTLPVLTTAPSTDLLTSHGDPGRVSAAAPEVSSDAPSQDTVAPDYGATAALWKGSRFSAPASTSGKVFFVADDGLNYVCSAGTVNSAGKNLVFTAGHCVHGGGAGRSWFDASRWTFAPSYDATKKKNPTPYGLWTASQLWSLSGWTDGGDRTYDIGVAVMQTDAWGTHIVNAVGGQGIEWNYPLEQYMYQFGYPSRTPFTGARLRYCTGTTYNDSGQVGINCNMTEGASGGSWLDDFDGTFGYLDSVNSWVFWDGGGVRYKWNGPYFGDGAANLYAAVQNL